MSSPTRCCTRCSRSTPRCGSTSGPPRRSRSRACFILAVDDTMDSILNWYREEGLIFKGGSGAGLNLSRIRSSKELLSSGGTASGPVSFMRGADASAGTIKSGGATRRAAKMVILDVDHPDIAEFIETKAREERKIRALRDAGFDMDLGGDRHHQRPVPERQQLGPGHRRVHAGRRDRFVVRPAGPAHRRGHRAGRRARAVRHDGRGRLGVRRPGHPVRRHHQRLAHLPGERTDHRKQPVLRVHAPGQLLVQPGLAEPHEVPARRRHVRRGDLRQGRRAGHHRDGHLDLLRGLPDRGDRRDHPCLPPAGHRLRQPGRAAHGHRSRLRLRGRAGGGCGDHLADDRHRVPALGRTGRRGRSLRRLRPQRSRPRSGHAQARRGERRDPHGRRDGPSDPRPGDAGLGRVHADR